MKRLMVVDAGYGGALIATYDFDGEMDESRVTEILKEIGIIRMNRLRARDELKYFSRPGWEVLDGTQRPIYYVFVANGIFDDEGNRTGDLDG